MDCQCCMIVDYSFIDVDADLGRVLFSAKRQSEELLPLPFLQMSLRLLAFCSKRIAMAPPRMLFYRCLTFKSFHNPLLCPFYSHLCIQEELRVRNNGWLKVIHWVHGWVWAWIWKQGPSGSSLCWLKPWNVMLLFPATTLKVPSALFLFNTYTFFHLFAHVPEYSHL